MRCDEVARELAVPTGRLGPAALAAHLAACAGCSAEVARADRLDRALAAARSPAPDPLAFDRLWAGVTRALETGAPEPAFSIEPPADSEPAPAPAVLPMSAAPMGRWRPGLALLAPLAAAAALLLAVFLPGPDPQNAPAVVAVPDLADDRPDPAAGALALADLFEVDIEQGETTIIHMGGDGPLVETRPFQQISETDEVPATIVIYNTMESLSSL